MILTNCHTSPGVETGVSSTSESSSGSTDVPNPLKLLQSQPRRNPLARSELLKLPFPNRHPSLTIGSGEGTVAPFLPTEASSAATEASAPLTTGAETASQAPSDSVTTSPASSGDSSWTVSEISLSASSIDSGNLESSPTSPSTPTDVEEPEIAPGACLFDGKVYVSAQQIPLDDHCDFCFCFRGDIICLQQSCPPPIRGCLEESIAGFCCPRYECPVRQVTHNFTWHSADHRNKNPTGPGGLASIPQGFNVEFSDSVQDGDQVEVEGCEIKGDFYRFGELVGPASGPCLECRWVERKFLSRNDGMQSTRVPTGANAEKSHGLVWIGGKPRRHWDGHTNKKTFVFFFNNFPATKSSHVKKIPFVFSPLKKILSE